MQSGLNWIPVAGCAIGVIYLAMALLASHEIIQAARAAMALAFAVVPYLTVRAVQAALSGRE